VISVWSTELPSRYLELGVVYTRRLCYGAMRSWSCVLLLLSDTAEILTGCNVCLPVCTEFHVLDASFVGGNYIRVEEHSTNFTLYGHSWNVSVFDDGKYLRSEKSVGQYVPCLQFTCLFIYVYLMTLSVTQTIKRRMISEWWVEGDVARKGRSLIWGYYHSMFLGNWGKLRETSRYSTSGSKFWAQDLCNANQLSIRPSLSV
jgi:hypothetical protein